MSVREHYYDGDTLYIRCAGCWQIKNASLFYKNKGKKFWIDTYCKECHSNKPKKKPTIEKVRMYQRRYREKDYDRYIKLKRAQREKSKLEKRGYKKKYEQKKTKEIWFSTNTFHQKTTNYIKKNNLRPEQCMLCWWGEHIQAHHPSYSSMNERANVVFVCDSCHKLIHTWEINCPEPVNLIQLNAHMPAILTDKDLQDVIQISEHSSCSMN